MLLFSEPLFFFIIVVRNSFAIEIEVILIRYVLSICNIRNEYVFVSYSNFWYLNQINFSSRLQKSKVELIYWKSMSYLALSIIWMSIQFHSSIIITNAWKHNIFWSENIITNSNNTIRIVKRKNLHDSIRYQNGIATTPC
jgi:hypothetical protein